MRRKDDDVGGRLISSAIVLLILTSLAPLISSGGPTQLVVLGDTQVFSSSSSNESYDLFIGSPTSESGGDGSISTAEPDGSSEELSVQSKVEFYSNEMISDIRFYGEGANNYIELSIYLKFTGNDGATTDVTFRLKSGSSTVEQVVLELDDPCTEGGGFGGIGGGSCSYAVNQINFEIDQGGFLVESGSKLGLEIDATIDGCQGGGGITGGDANCDVEVQFGDIDSTSSFSKLEVKANALANSAVKVHMPGSGWTDNEVLEWYPNHRQEFREMQFTLQVKDAFGRDDIESVNLIMSTNEGATRVFNEEFEDDDLTLDNNGLVGNFTYTFDQGIEPGDYEVILEIKDIQGHTVLFEHQGLEFMEHGIYLTLPSNQPDTVLIAPGQTSSVEFLIEHTGSTSSDLEVVFDLARSLPSSWSDPIWDKPQGYSLQGGSSSARPILQIDVPEGDLSNTPEKLEVEARAFADIDGTVTEVAIVEIVLNIEEVGVYAPPRVSIYEDEEHQIQISDSTRPEFYDETLSHYVDSDEIGDFYIDVFNSGFDTDSFFIRVNEMPTSWQYKFFDNDTGMELIEEGINSVTPDIGSGDVLTIRMEIYPPVDRDAQDIGMVSFDTTSSGDSNLQTESRFTVHRTFGILAEVISDSDGGDLGTVGPIEPGQSLSYSVRVSDTSDLAGETTWRLVNPKDLKRNTDADMGYSSWDYTITDNQGNDIIVINLAADTYEDIVLGITLPENVEAGNQTIYLRVSEEGVDTDEARYFDLPVTVVVEEDVQPGRLPITQKSEYTRFSSDETKNIEFRISNDNNIPLDVVIELEEPNGWEGEIAVTSSQVGGGFLLVTLPPYTSKDFFVELTAPSNLKDGTDVEFVLKVTPLDDEVPYSSDYTQLSKFNFKTECTGLSCFMNEIYDPEPQTLALGAGLVMLFILAVYRRGRYDSTASNIVEVPAEEEMKLEEEIQMDIPEPVVEQDDDIELLDELDSI
ncbi:MAG: hypothetical protein VXW28_02075 [Candidatus Thermoplasmatota archaeon]|nr:hypothetical protein [Candidatus Thermoplasmatota archaeon]